MFILLPCYFLSFDAELVLLLKTGTSIFREAGILALQGTTEIYHRAACKPKKGLVLRTDHPILFYSGFLICFVFVFQFPGVITGAEHLHHSVRRTYATLSVDLWRVADHADIRCRTVLFKSRSANFICEIFYQKILNSTFSYLFSCSITLAPACL